MKVNKVELQNALEKVRPGLANRDLIEQATSFAFIDGRVVTYNDEISISHPVVGLENVKAAIKAQVLYDFLSKIKKDEIDLEWTDNQVIIKAGRAKAGLIFEQEVKLPLSELDKITDWQKLPEGFVDALKLCIPCCSKDMSRPVLTCVHISSNIVEASDSYQIIRYTLQQKSPGKAMLIPSTSVKELVQYDIKEISQGDSWAHFKTSDNTIFSTRIIGDNFPDIGKHLKVNGDKFSFPETMPDALNRANVFAKKTSVDIPMATIQVKNEQLLLSAKNEFGWFEEKMKTQHKDLQFKLSIGIYFLTTLFEKLQTCIIGQDKIGFSGPNWQHVIAITAGPVDEDQLNDDAL